MSDGARVLANRANARLSTGPRSPAGKARTACNALRHGLNASVLADPALAPQVATLARRIAGEQSAPQLFALACRIAEARIDLQRVRRHSRHLMDLAEEEAQRAPVTDAPSAPAGSFPAALEARIERLASRLRRPPEGPQAERLAERVRSLAGLDRYERRTRSRFKAAIRAFDEASSFWRSKANLDEQNQ